MSTKRNLTTDDGTFVALPAGRYITRIGREWFGFFDQQLIAVRPLKARPELEEALNEHARQVYRLEGMAAALAAKATADAFNADIFG
jgi:hypothetical protein